MWQQSKDHQRRLAEPNYGRFGDEHQPARKKQAGAQLALSSTGYIGQALEKPLGRDVIVWRIEHDVGLKLIEKRLAGVLNLAINRVSRGPILKQSLDVPPQNIVF